jgi:16S rRNA A1518/A1519 N6-dimethyltransferase RsmA/KsgA/DIM1 with predicted DNA glycosylase/AP lyase activity
MRRKQLQRVLRSVAGLSVEEASGLLNRVGIDPSARPEVVGPEQFARLFRELKSNPDC